MFLLEIKFYIIVNMFPATHGLPNDDKNRQLSIVFNFEEKANKSIAIITLYT